MPSTAPPWQAVAEQPTEPVTGAADEAGPACQSMAQVRTRVREGCGTDQQPAQSRHRDDGADANGGPNSVHKGSGSIVRSIVSALTPVPQAPIYFDFGR